MCCLWWNFPLSRASWISGLFYKPFCFSQVGSVWLFFNPELCPSPVSHSSKLFVCTNWKVKARIVLSTFEIKFDLGARQNGSFQASGIQMKFLRAGDRAHLLPAPMAPPGVLQVPHAAGTHCWWHWAPGAELFLGFGADICIFAQPKLYSPEWENVTMFQILLPPSKRDALSLSWQSSPFKTKD